MLHKRATFIVVTAILTTLLVLALAGSPRSALNRAELVVHDGLATIGRKTEQNPKLIFLAIDSESIALDEKADLRTLFEIGDAETAETQALKLMSEHWPWPRSVYAHILDRLVAAGAKTVVFDLTFPTPSGDDTLFRAALEKYADKVVVGSNFTDSGERSPGVNAALALPTETLIPRSTEPDPRVGYVNFWTDPDGVVREARFHTSFAQFLGTPEIPGEPIYASLAAHAVSKFGRPELVPADSSSHRIRFTAAPEQGFRPRSIFEIFVPEYWERNYRSGAIFDGAIVVIGAAGNWQHDEHQTPLGLMAGPELQLNVINALLQRQFLEPFSGPVLVGIYLLAALLAVTITTRCNSPTLRFAFIPLLALGWLALQLPLFDRGIVAPVIGPLAILLVTGFLAWVHDFIRTSTEQIRLRVALVERKKAQELLESANEELERRVAERTTELTRANAALTGLLEEKIVLLKEVHHRVKNNLQIISSLLNLQSGYIHDPVALQCFNESRNRVRSMALIHEKLYQSQDLSKIDFQDYVRTLASGLQASFAGKAGGIRIAVDVAEVALGVDCAVPCGLIVNELVTNCFKYAFPAGQGEIRIAMRRLPEESLQLVVSDNGVGFPKDLDFRNTESLGMQVVTTLTDQIEGTIALRNGVGTTFEITFPESSSTKS